MMTTGCSTFCGWFDSSGPQQPGPATTKSASQQLAEGRASFEQKIIASRGASLSKLRTIWGSLEPGISRDNLTVYRWSQTAKLTTPTGMVTKASSAPPATSSCLAVFIVDRKGVVVDANSEGQCFDYRFMPAWKPVITQSTDGKTGAVK